MRERFMYQCIFFLHFLFMWLLCQLCSHQTHLFIFSPTSYSHGNTRQFIMASTWDWQFFCCCNTVWGKSALAESEGMGKWCCHAIFSHVLPIDSGSLHSSSSVPVETVLRRLQPAVPVSYTWHLLRGICAGAQRVQWCEAGEFSLLD